MTHETTEQIKQNIVKLREQLEVTKAERVARGLPADSPPNFVPIAMSWTLYNKCKPLIDYSVKYASLCDKTNEVIEISDDQMTWIKSYEMNVIFLSKARTDLGLIALGVGGVYNVLNRYETYETAGELLRDIVKYVRLASHTPA